MHALWYRFTETHIFSEGEEPEVNCSSFTNTWPILISNGSITIYVPRAFQRTAPHPLILQHIQKAQLLVRLERFGTLSDIRSRHSSYEELFFLIDFSDRVIMTSSGLIRRLSLKSMYVWARSLKSIRFCERIRHPNARKHFDFSDGRS